MATAQLPVRSRVVGTLSCQQNSYLQSLETKVVSCTPYTPPKPDQKPKNKKSNAPDTKYVSSSAGRSWLIEFNDSVLFPEGGGQPTDHGTLVPLGNASSGQPIKIEYIQRQGLKCMVHSPQPLEPGTPVRQEVDFDRRWDLMQQHTGQHLLTAIMNTYDNLNTLGWGMGAEGEMNYVDLPRKPTEAELHEIQRKVNDAIQQNLSITVESPEDANVDKLPDDYDKEAGVIRVIKIGDLDNNTCCGTHLQQTSHISLLLLGPSTPASSSRTRQFFASGNRAIALATQSLSTVRSISRQLSSSTAPADVTASLTRLQDSTAALKKRETKLLAELAQYEIERVKGCVRDGRNAFVYRPEPGMEFVNVVAAGVRDEVGDGNVVVLASGEGREGGAVLVIGAKEAVEGMVMKVKELIPGIKGGGKGERWQGKVAEWKGGDIEKFRELVRV